MKFFRNKHVITAMIVAPILAILSYYLVDLAVKEQPQKAIAGNAYKLIAKSNCRFSSGSCDLENGSFKSTLRVSEAQGLYTLHLDSQNPLQDANVGFVTADGDELGPFNLSSLDGAGNAWATQFNVPVNEYTILRVALVAGGAHYYAETTMGFSNYQTSFNRDFRKDKE